MALLEILLQPEEEAQMLDDSVVLGQPDELRVCEGQPVCVDEVVTLAETLPQPVGVDVWLGDSEALGLPE